MLIFGSSAIRSMVNRRVHISKRANEAGVGDDVECRREVLALK